MTTMMTQDAKNGASDRTVEMKLVKKGMFINIRVHCASKCLILVSVGAAVGGIGQMFRR